MKYFIDDTDIEFNVGDVVALSFPVDGVHFGIITRIEDTLWLCREQLNVYINGESLYYKHTDIVALYRLGDDAELKLVWKSSIYPYKE